VSSVLLENQVHKSQSKNKHITGILSIAGVIVISCNKIKAENTLVDVSQL